MSELSDRLTRHGKIAGAVAAGILLAVTVQVGWRRGRFYWNRDMREQFACKAVNSTLSLEVLEVIREQDEFSVAQILALIEIESEGYYKRISPKGAVGLMQVMPIHAHNAQLAVDDLYDPVVNVRLGIEILSKNMKRYNNNEYYAVSAYNCGSKRWDQIIGGKKAISRETATFWRRYRKSKAKYEKWIEKGIWSE